MCPCLPAGRYTLSYCIIIFDLFTLIDSLPILFAILLVMKRKTDSNQPATKGDIQIIKTDLKNVKSALWNQSLKVEERVEKVEESLDKVEDRLGVVEVKLDKVEDKLESMDDKLDKIGDTLYGFVKRVDDLTTETQVGTYHTEELRIQLEDHEKRIKYLENTKHDPK
jgi:chromosome segregation ATPase